MELIGSLECEIEIVYNWMQPWRCWLHTQKWVHAGSSMAYRIGLSFGSVILAFVWWYLCVKVEFNDR